MPKVSRNILSEEVHHQIMDGLVRSFARTSDEAKIKKFMNDPFTPTEKIMLAKRLMASVLLQRGYGYLAICRMLKLSKATVNFIKRDIERSGEGYRLIYESIFKEKGSRLNKWLEALRLPMKGSRRDMRRWKKALYEL